MTLEFVGSPPGLIPEDLQELFYPATHYLYEWETYWVRCAGADGLRVGDHRIAAVADGLFPVRFENSLGLSTLQAYAGSEPLHEPVVVEVISPKFETLETHYQFYSALLDEVFTSAARLPFTIAAPTHRGTADSRSRPDSLFTYHFFCSAASRLRAALAAIQSRPHRELSDDPAFVPLSEATSMDADVLLGVMHHPEEWQRASGLALSRRLRGFAPARVWQRQPEETLNTLENRFARGAVREFLEAGLALRTAPWWDRAPAAGQERVQDTLGVLQDALASAPLAGAGPMEALPLEGLLRREGYRDLLALWYSFQGAKQPLFARLQEAIDLRDIATLYEIWVFFRLVEEMGSLLGLPREGAGLQMDLSDTGSLAWGARARFGAAALLYNQAYVAARGQDRGCTSYSVPLRPDFTWMVEGRPVVVLDAKFRLDRPPREGDEDASPAATARQGDLYKMHAYRDSLGVRAAVVLYPGTTSLFYHRSGEADGTVTLPRLLQEPLSGVGAIPLVPLGNVEN